MDECLRSKACFFEKKQQKTFAPLRACMTPSSSHQKNQSFFASFCSQKEVLSSSVDCFGT
jgi:hypothetical protein